MKHIAEVLASSELVIGLGGVPHGGCNMLVLSRRVGEELVFHDSMGEMAVAKITVIEIKKGSVRLGLEFPKRLTITRNELRPRDDQTKS